MKKSVYSSGLDELLIASSSRGTYTLYEMSVGALPIADNVPNDIDEHIFSFKHIVYTITLDTVFGVRFGKSNAIYYIRWNQTLFM